jgi:hypothetical protein
MRFIVVLAIIGFVIFLTTRLRQRRVTVGPGAIGTVYDMLNQDRRNAVEIIVEERAEARDPEDADGNLPDLQGKPPTEDPKR